MLRRGLFAVLGVVILLAGTAGAAPQEWGTIKGQVVWDGGGIPARIVPNLGANQAVCAAAAAKAGKPLLTENYVIDPQTKGVKWVVVWLVDPKDVKAQLPIHPALVKPKEAKVVMDQPCCFFEPHVLCMREGQVLEAKNSAPVAHNYKVDSPKDNPSANPLIPPGGSTEIEGWKAHVFPSSVGCTIHPGMKAYIRVFNHPYFAVTDEKGNFEIKNAPAGDWNIVMWQEEVGWFLGGRDKKGVPITVKPGATTDLGQYKLTPEK